MSEPRIKR